LIEKLSHYNTYGAVWSIISEEQATVFIVQAATLQKISVEAIHAKLAEGAEIEYEYTDWESTPCKIRDAEVARKKQQEMNAILAKRAAERRATRKYYICRSCGTEGYGGKYPFSTCPSSGFCDDCL
jgi:rubrerythrin